LFKERDRLLALKQELSGFIKSAKAGLPSAKVKLRKRTPFRDGSIPLNSPKKMMNQSNNLSGKKPRAAATASKTTKPKPVSRLSTAYRSSRSRKEPSVETAETEVDYLV
jgi:hypothetical protein